MKQLFFVLSSGRSGSRTIAHALNSHTDCICYHEREPNLAVEGPQFFYGQYSESKIAEMFQSTRQFDKIDKIYGESNLQFCLMFPVIDRLYPDTKYIWMLRDGRDVVASMYYRGWFDPDDKKILSEWKKARLQGDLAGDFTPDDWNAQSRFAKCCWLWKKYNTIIEDHMGSLDNSRWMQVRLDKLKASKSEIYEFLGLNKDKSVLVEKTNKAYQPVIYWENWGEEEKTTFEAICGDVMNRWFPDWKNDKGKWIKINTEEPDEPGFCLRVKRKITGLPRVARVKAGMIKRKMLGID